MKTPETVAPNGGTGEQQSDTMDGSKSTEKQENLLERCLTKSSDSTVTIMRAHMSAVPGPVQGYYYSIVLNLELAFFYRYLHTRV